MSITTVKNYTRYNTADLEAIVGLVEERALQLNGKVKLRNGLTYLEFNHFTQGIPKGPRRRYQTSPAPERLYLGKTQWNHLEKFAIVEPRYAFSSELEWLSVGASDTPVAPAALVKALADTIMARFEVPWNRDDGRQVDVSSVQLRIEGSVMLKKTSGEKKDVRLQKAERRMKSVSHSIGRALMYLRTAQQNMGVVQKHLKGETAVSDGLVALMAVINGELTLSHDQAKETLENIKGARKEAINA